MGILWTIIIGFLAGVIAKFIMPGPNEPSGFILTTILGIVGAFVATFIGSPKMNLMPAQVTAVDELGVTLEVGTPSQPHSVRAAVAAHASQALEVGSMVTLGIRAEHWREVHTDSDVFQGHITMVEHLGESNMLYVTLNNGCEVVARGERGHRRAHHRDGGGL